MGMCCPCQQIKGPHLRPTQQWSIIISYYYYFIIFWLYYIYIYIFRYMHGPKYILRYFYFKKPGRMLWQTTFSPLIHQAFMKTRIISIWYGEFPSVSKWITIIRHVSSMKYYWSHSVSGVIVIQLASRQADCRYTAKRLSQTLTWYNRGAYCF